MTDVPAPPTARLTPARRRALLAFTAFGAGLVIARAWNPSQGSGVFFGIAAVLAAMALVTPKMACRGLLLAGVVMLGLGWWSFRMLESGRSSLVGVTGNGLVCVEGIALDTPRKIIQEHEGLNGYRRENPKWRFDLRADTLVSEKGPIEIAGSYWVTCSGEAPPIRAGQRVRVTGLFKPPEPPDNPGENDLRLYARQAGFAGLLSLSGPALVIPISEAPDGMHARAIALVDALRLRARSVLLRACGDHPTPQTRALLLGLVLGENDEGMRPLRDAFARTGLAHVLSISGFHLAVMALVALTLVRLGGDHGRLEPLVVGVLVLLYALIVPPASPIARSAIMVLAILAGEVIGRRHDRLTLLIWIGLGLLVWRPLDLWSIGYQLSLGLTALLFWAGRDFHARLFRPAVRTGLSRPRSAWSFAWDSCRSLFAASLLCWGVSAPLLMGRIGLLSPGAILATILVTPLIVLILWIAYAVLLLGMFVPGVGDAAASVLSTLASLASSMVEFIDRAPLSSLRVPPLPMAWIVLSIAGALWWVRRGHRRDLVAWAFTLASVGWLGLLLLFGQRLDPSLRFRIDMLRVGDGTCHLLRVGDDAILWDCAPVPNSGVMHPLAQSVRALGVWRVPTVVLTHPDMDHYASLPDLLEPLGVRRVYLPPRSVDQARAEPTGPAAWLLDHLATNRIEVFPITRGGTIPLGSLRLDILSPPADVSWPQDNDHSIIAALRSEHGVDLLLTGDAQAQALAALADHAPGLRPRILELPHHGSANPIAIAFAAAARPTLVLQSTGPSRLDDPRWQPLRILSPAWYVTARHGAAWAEVETNGTLRHGAMHR